MKKLTALLVSTVLLMVAVGCQQEKDTSADTGERKVTDLKFEGGAGEGMQAVEAKE